MCSAGTKIKQFFGYFFRFKKAWVQHAIQCVSSTGNVYSMQYSVLHQQGTCSHCSPSGYILDMYNDKTSEPQLYSRKKGSFN